MLRTRPLQPPSPRFPLEIHPLARLTPDGRLALLTSAFPPLARVRLVLWHPGAHPAFTLAEGRVEPGWGWAGPAADGWVVAWVAVGDPAQTS